MPLSARDLRRVGASCPGRRASALALALALAFASAPGCTQTPASRASEPQLTTPLEPVAPSGEVNGPITFSWRGISADRVVRIYIVDAAERAVTDFEARGQSAAAPPIVLDALQPGTAMGWRVAVLDENGQPARLSPLTRFVWQPTRPG